MSSETPESSHASSTTTCQATAAPAVARRWTRATTTAVVCFPLASFVTALSIASAIQQPLPIGYHMVASFFLSLAFGGTMAADIYLANAVAAISAMKPVPASESGSDRDRAITAALLVNVGALMGYVFGSLGIGFVAYNKPPLAVLYAAPYVPLTVMAMAVYLVRQNAINKLDAEDDEATAAAAVAAADRAATNDAAIVADVRRMIADRLDDAAIALAVRTKYFVLAR